MKNEGFFQDETTEKVESLKQGNSGMLVIVRARPLTNKESASSPQPCVKVIDSKLLSLFDPSQDSQRKRSKQTQFSFDFVYGQETSTKQLYDQSVSGCQNGVLEGYNSTILAYGATGCGKTFTMIGQPTNPGICALSLIDLLSHAQTIKNTHHISIRLSYVQIYNEIIKDLLVSEDKVLDLREDPKDGVQLIGATQIPVSSLLQLNTLLKVGAVNRSKETTVSNQASSRSHAILMVKTEVKQKVQGLKEETTCGKLHLVDLAGSQRSIGGKGTRQYEGSKINRSLLVLGNCIQILAEGASNRGHVPFRESKLTRLLKEALGGNCRTVMLACVSPFANQREETYNTLQYASRARNIGSNAVRNVLNSEAHLSSYVALIGNLKRENDELKKQLQGQKNYSLPHLKMGHLNQQNERITEKIESHFAKQLTLLRCIHELYVKIDKVAFKLLKIQMAKGKEVKGKANKHLKEQQQKQNEIQQLDKEKQTMQKRLQDIILKRSLIVQDIRDSQLNPLQATSLMNSYKERKVEIQLQQVKLRQLRLEKEHQERNELLNMMNEQIKLREKIIEQQRLLIQKNNIINRITYTRINQPAKSVREIAYIMRSSRPNLIKKDNNQFKNTSILLSNEHVKSSHHSKKKNKRKQVSEETLTLDNSTEVRRNSNGKGKKSMYKIPQKKHQQLDHIYMQR